MNDEAERETTMSFERFKDALFELADTWVESVAPAAYARIASVIFRLLALIVVILEAVSERTESGRK